MELLQTLSPYLIPLITLIVGYLGDRGLRALQIRKGSAEAQKAETEVESTKISDMEKSLKFWVENSNKMREELTEVYLKMDGVEDKFDKRILDEEEGKLEMKKLILQLKVERDEFRILNNQLRETIARQDAKIMELEKFIQKQNMKISTLESKLQKYNDSNDFTD